MIRGFTLAMAVTSLVGLVGVYGLKYSVEETASQKSTLERQIERQEGELSMLKADWAYLNQPGRVAPIVERHADVLGLVPIQQSQFGTFEGLPMRVAPPDKAALDELFLALEGGVDPAGEAIEEDN